MLSGGSWLTSKRVSLHLRGLGSFSFYIKRPGSVPPFRPIKDQTRLGVRPQTRIYVNYHKSKNMVTVGHVPLKKNHLKNIYKYTINNKTPPLTGVIIII